MPTRKQLLEDLQEEMGYLAESVQRNTDIQESPRDVNVSVDTSGLNYSLDNLSSAIGRGAGAIIAGLFIGGYMYLQAQLVKHLIRNIREMNQKSDMIDSIQSLQEAHPHLTTYEFVVERSYARGAGREKRQNILNGLIADGIVTEISDGEEPTLVIFPDNPDVIDYWDWVDEVYEALSKLKKN